MALPLCLPRALPPGGMVGVVNPSSPVEPELLDAGVAVLQSRGFRVVSAPHVRDRDGHHAGSPADRARDFFDFYADPALDVLWCARGGSSACCLWPLLDWPALAALPPKMVIGYSDTTSLLLPLNQCVGTVALHGPLMFELGHTPADALDWQLGLLQDARPGGLVPGRAAHTLIGGRAEGRLSGGCLSLVAATLGTPYQIDARGGLLLLEDIDEAPHRVERLLVQLDQAGVLGEAAGFVIGDVTRSDQTNALPLSRLWSDLLTPYGKPAVRGFPFGHVSPNYALPLGVRARLDADAGTLTLLEAAVSLL